MPPVALPFTPDVAGHVERLFIYPVKSCAGIELAEALLLATGLEWDRRWMVVDAAGTFVTQRTLPRMALVRPAFEAGALLLHAPGMPALPVPLQSNAPTLTVQVWDDSLAADDMGDAAAAWLSGFLGQRLRLVRFASGARRLSSRKWTGDVDATLQFSDAFALLVTSSAALVEVNRRLEASGEPPVGIERFRPNLVLGGVPAHDEDHMALLQLATAGGVVQLQPVKPCVRCTIPNVDPASGHSHPAVSDAIQTYRHDARMEGAVTWGMNAIVRAGAGLRLAVGQPAEASYRFD
ncbi:MAG: Flavodoxin reductases (ferredoxin-NADPH reductases) family 1 [Burkholderiaceae bacterium]|jgi:uncharacterized protein YcbX|nr:MAG: Flavodoxin reductases (ferredoxin-NADPH reductases) family 1 [Burkholderiaceae bacterium]